MNTCLHVACALALFSTGCVTTRIDRPERSWPKPVDATNLKQFEGVYRNSALEMLEGGKPAENTTELFVFLSGPAQADEGEGRQVEIRVADGGEVLQLRLRDQNGRLIRSANLRQGTDFTLAGGALVILPNTGLGADTFSNWVAGVERTRSELRVTTTGSLMGKDTSRGVGLLMAIIPVAEATQYYWFWPKNAQ